jgi:hypothetical protein
MLLSMLDWQPKRVRNIKSVKYFLKYELFIKKTDRILRLKRRRRIKDQLIQKVFCDSLLLQS